MLFRFLAECNPKEDNGGMTSPPRWSAAPAPRTRDRDLGGHRDGDHGTAVRQALLEAGVDVLSYDKSPGADGVSGALWGHLVIAVEEIDDIDALAVTSVDLAQRTLVTDYVAGVVVCVGAYADWPFLDPETLNVVTDTPVLAHRMFTPRHPAIVVSGPDADPASSAKPRWWPATPRLCATTRGRARLPPAGVRPAASRLARVDTDPPPARTTTRF